MLTSPSLRVASPTTDFVPRTVLLPIPSHSGALRPLRRSAVLLNANAKRVDARVVAGFRELVSEDDLFLSRSLEEGRAMAADIVARGYATVMLGGGDGTVAAAIGMLDAAAREQGRPTPGLVILKLGTGNALASLVDAGAPLLDARRALLGHTEPERVPLRVLESPDHPGVVFPFGSLGYDAQVLNDYVDVVQRTRSPLGRRLAKSLGGYFYAVATRSVPSELRRPPVSVTIRSLGRASLLDPETTEEIPLDPGTTLFSGGAKAVLVGSTPNYGYGMKVLPYARRRFDRFQLRVSTASVAYVLSHLPSIWNGRLRTAKFVDFLVEDIEIQTSSPMPLQLSGDAAGSRDRLRVALSERSFDIHALRR